LVGARKVATKHMVHRFAITQEKCSHAFPRQAGLVSEQAEPPPKPVGAVGQWEFKVGSEGGATKR